MDDGEWHVLSAVQTLREVSGTDGARAMWSWAALTPVRAVSLVAVPLRGRRLDRIRKCSVSDHVRRVAAPRPSKPKSCTRSATIQRLAKEGKTQREIAELVGVSQPTVGRVLDSKRNSFEMNQAPDPSPPPVPVASDFAMQPSPPVDPSPKWVMLDLSWSSDKCLMMPSSWASGCAAAEPPSWGGGPMMVGGAAPGAGRRRRFFLYLRIEGYLRRENRRRNHPKTQQRRGLAGDFSTP